MIFNVAVADRRMPRCAGCRKPLRSPLSSADRTDPLEVIVAGRWTTLVDARLGQIVHHCHPSGKPAKKATPSGRTEVWNRRAQLGATATSGMPWRSP